MHPHRLGTLGEAAAAKLLLRGGWRILARNHRLGRNEVDLVAWKEGILAFVEVKTRSGERFGHPLEAITPRDRREVERVARGWLAGARPPGCDDLAIDGVRFDAIAVRVRVGGSGEWQLIADHIADAWRPWKS